MRVLRHSAALEWLSKGLSLAKTAAYLGDSKEAVLSLYAHFMPSDDDLARKLMDGFLSPPAEGPNAPRMHSARRARCYGWSVAYWLTSARRRGAC